MGFERRGIEICLGVFRGGTSAKLDYNNSTAFVPYFRSGLQISPIYSGAEMPEFWATTIGLLHLVFAWRLSIFDHVFISRLLSSVIEFCGKFCLLRVSWIARSLILLKN